MPSNLFYWAGIGTIYLIMLTYQDYKRKMVVDERRNWFMMGLSISLISHFSTSLWYFLLLIGMVMLMHFINNKYEFVGSSNITSMMWCIYGFAIIGWNVLLWWFLIFAFCAVVYSGAKMVLINVLKTDKNILTPFYPVLLFSFVINCFVSGVY